MRLAKIETALAGFEDRAMRFPTQEIACAGAFVAVDAMGQLRIERGYVRPEDEPPAEPEPVEETARTTASNAVADFSAAADVMSVAPSVRPGDSDDEMTLKPIPDRLLTELTAWRTLALRNARGERPDVALLAALHALCLRAFYRYPLDTRLDIELGSVSLSAQGGYGFAETKLARNFDARHARWQLLLPKEPEDLWPALVELDADNREAFFAHCVSLALNALFEAYNRRPRALIHSDRLAETLDLDMTEAGWKPTVETYLGRVTKARILAAVGEARGDDAARRLEDLRKGEMAETAESLLEGSGWLPEPLRTPGRPFGDVVNTATAAGEYCPVSHPAPPSGVDEAAGENDTYVDAEGPHDREAQGAAEDHGCIGRTLSSADMIPLAAAE